MCVQLAQSIKCFHCMDRNDGCVKNGTGKIVDCEYELGWRDTLLEVAQLAGDPELDNLKSVSANGCQNTTSRGLITRSCAYFDVAYYGPKIDACDVVEAAGRMPVTCRCSHSLCNGLP